MKRFAYNDLHCFGLQQALRRDGALEIVLSAPEAEAFSRVLHSLSVSQRIDEQPFNIVRVWALLLSLVVQLFRRAPSAWRALFSYRRLSEVSEFWRLEAPLIHERAEQQNGQVLFTVRRPNQSFNSDVPAFGRAAG